MKFACSEVPCTAEKGQVNGLCSGHADGACLRVLLLPQHYVKFACSEEVPEPVDLQGSGFSVAFDPLDGSSIVDTNFTVGTIFGIWPGDKLTGITGRDQVMRFSVSSSTCILTSHHILAACCSSE